MKRSWPIWVVCLLCTKSVVAQNVTVQQPVVGVTSVSTSVMVPDRGRSLLGGVSSAQSSRSRFGFVPSGSAAGTSRVSRNLSVGVTITDLREMDEAVLNSVPDRSANSTRFARHAAAIRSAAAESSNQGTRDVESAAERAARFERLALNAEAENRLGVAKLHWQMAAKYGSTMARERLVAGSR